MESRVNALTEQVGSIERQLGSMLQQHNKIEQSIRPRMLSHQQLIYG